MPPWKITIPPPVAPSLIGFRITDEARRHIADVMRLGAHTKPHAHMIAAAPDMLAALQTFVDLFGREDAYQGDPAGLACVRSARAAIAKATGKEG